MTQAKAERQCFSSPDQIQKMAKMVSSRWQDIWPVVVERYQAEQQARKAQIKRAIQNSLPKAS